MSGKGNEESNSDAISGSKFFDKECREEVGSDMSNEFSFAMEEMKKKGLIVVTSAGDTEISLEKEDDHNSSWPSYLAADNTHVITVGSSERNGEATEKSNRGRTVVSLHAPGEGIYATMVSPKRILEQADEEKNYLGKELQECKKKIMQRKGGVAVCWRNKKGSQIIFTNRPKTRKKKQGIKGMQINPTVTSMGPRLVLHRLWEVSFISLVGSQMQPAHK